MRRSKSSSNKDKLLSSVLLVLATHPSASMVDVAAQLGIGRTTLYRYFTNHEQMVEEAARLGARLFGDAFMKARPSEGLGLFAVERICTQLFLIPDVLTLMFADNPIITDEIFAQVENERHAASMQTNADMKDVPRHASSNDPMEEVIRRGQRDGSITQQVPVQWAAMHVFLTIGSGHLFSLATKDSLDKNERETALALTIRAVKLTLGA